MIKHWGEVCNILIFISSFASVKSNKQRYEA